MRRCVRAPTHVKFRPGVKFSISTRAEKNWCHTWASTRDETNIFLLHFTPGWKYVCKDLRRILEKCFMEKDVCMQLQDYIKTMMLDFINKRSMMFSFKTFKIVLLATINSKILTVSLLLNLCSCYERFMIKEGN